MLDEVVSFAREYINNRAYRTPERKAKIKEVLRQLTGEKLNFGCSTCYIEALFKILNLTKMATPKGYELKQGVLLQAFGHPEMACTNITLTDEKAEWYMKHFPEKAVYFSKLASDPIPVAPPEVKIIQPLRQEVIPAPEDLIKKVIGEPKKRNPKTKK